ncbi:RHS repeat-associated core domain-containing protein [Pseudomonas sp. O230]|uniref:RHS repeat-associated core domain-containing protein n=1 Tax=Pseudomonas sp. O230 TaxID=3159450 RepID=UPI00387AB154
MHSHTPSISVIGPRGLAVRAVAYHRRAVNEPLDTWVTHQLHDAVGRLTQQRDPRLFALMQSGVSVPPNLSTLYSLSGQSLCSDSVDAGWQLSLCGAAGQALEAWDQRGWHRRSELDALLRPVAIFEHCVAEAERCAERITWGSSSPDDALHNRCGQAVRHDDPAGSRLLPEYGLSGVVLAEVRHFLDNLDSPDWPVTEAGRNQLLEPGDGAHSAWRFAATGEALSQTDAKGHVRHFAQDRVGQLREVCLQRAGNTAVETLVNDIEYNAFGQVQQERAGNGMRTFCTYDPADGRLLSLANQDPDGVFLQHLSYRYDPSGNITEIADAALPIQYFANQRIEPVRRFSYDTLYQLIKATGWETAKPSFGPALPEWQGFGPPDASRWRNYSETYHYDAAGNLLKRLHLGAENDTLSMQVAANSNRSIKQRPGTDPATLFDVRGNLLELQPGQALQWNGRNELAQVIQVARLDAAADLERYVYDSEGMRLRKWRSAAAKSVSHTSEVRYLPGIELHSHTASGEQLQVVSVQAGHCSVRLLHWDSPPPEGVANDQLRYCFDDHLGSSAVEVDAEAKPISQEVFYPFGGTAWLAGRCEVETSYKTIRYSGKERDATGLYYYGARYYATWLLHWLNPDPAGDVDGMNFYRFVRNNPIGFMDQQGRISISAIINDSLVEQRGDVSHMIRQRSLNNIRQHLPEVADALITALGTAKGILKDTVSELEGGHFDVEVVRLYFGDVGVDDVNYLIDGYRELLADIESLESEQDRFVVFSGEGDYSDTSAFTFVSAKRKKIYFNSEVILKRTTKDNAHTIIHELSHGGGIFRSMDYWYLGMNDQEWKEAAENNIPHADIDSCLYSFMEGDSKHMMESSSFDPAFFVEGNRTHLIFKAGVDNFDEALKKFETSLTFRGDAALENADTLAAFAGAMSRARQLRTAQP